MTSRLIRIPKDTLAVRVLSVVIEVWRQIIGQPPLDIAPNKVSLTYIYAVIVSIIISLFTQCKDVSGIANLDGVN